MPIAQKPLLLVISQVYVPDPASVGQHMADVGEAMVERGYDVRVLTSRSGYENPTVRYVPREQRGGVDVVRLPCSSFGKKTLAHRLLGQSLFLSQVLIHGLFARRLTKILVSTSPPMGSLAAVAIAFVRRVPIVYWVMDLNPDQAVALHKVGPKNPLVLAMRWLNRRIFGRAADVIVLDRFMAGRVRSQYRLGGQLHIIPPWPHEDFLASDEGPNPFRAEHNPDNKFVVMYSGNHSPASPVTTLVQAAMRMQDDPRFLFMFIGGGQGKREVDEAIAEHKPRNMLSLPYQPLERIRYSLPAADIHAVTLGNDMVGIIHPCKIYGAMAVGRPVLFIGPRPSHATDLLDQHAAGWHVQQGEVDELIAKLHQAIDMPAFERLEMGHRAHSGIAAACSKSKLCPSFCEVVAGTATHAKQQLHVLRDRPTTTTGN